MSPRLSVRWALSVAAVAGAAFTAPNAALADPFPGQIKPLAKCASKVPTRPTVNGVKVSPGVISVYDSYAWGNLRFNVASPTADDEPVHVLYGIYEWGIQRFGMLGVDTVGCSTNTVPMKRVFGLEKSGGPVQWKPNTLYTVYVLHRSTPSSPPDPVYGNSWLEALRFFSETPLLKPPAAAFWTTASKTPPPVSG